MKPINSNWFVRARLKNRHIPLLVALGDTGNLNRAAEGLGDYERNRALAALARTQR